VVSGPPLLVMIGGIALIIAFLFVVDAVLPRDLSAAMEYLEGKGWREVTAEETSEYCGRNEKLYRFRGIRDNDVHASGNFCFHLVRPLSKIRAVDEVKSNIPAIVDCSENGRFKLCFE